MQFISFPDPPEQATAGVDQTVILGNQATLTCNLESGNTGNPDAMFTWTRTNDGDWSMETSDGTVTFTVDKLDMEDTYQCLPWNIHGQGQADTVSLTVQGYIIILSHLLRP